MSARVIDVLWRYGAALAATVATSVVIGAILGVATIGNLPILYLIPVLIAATRLGRGPAILASVAAFLIYDWFFIQPLHQITIADPAEWLALLLFLLTAIITSQLAASERARAEVAIRREREASLLYEALRLMGEPDLDAALRAVAERVRAELAVPAVAVELEVAGKPHRVTVGDASAIALPTDLLSTGTTGKGGRWIRVVPPSAAQKVIHIRKGARRFEVPIRADERTIGTIALIRDEKHASFAPHEGRLLTLLATQLAALASRAELQDATTRAEILRRADELKSALLSAVSHDLRTPLASILASASSLRQRDVRWTDAERDEFLETIEQQAERLSRIVNNLLDLSRIQAGALRPDKQVHEIGTVIDDVLTRLAPALSGRRVVTHVDEDVPVVAIDEVQIDQVLSNLVENASKYSPVGTEIRVDARREGDEIVVEVSDRGPGIPAGELDQLFTPFHRAPSARSVPGFGVGLAVARGLVEAHGGKIWAGNRPDGGARFSFTLPIDTRLVEPAGSRA